MILGRREGATSQHLGDAAGCDVASRDLFPPLFSPWGEGAVSRCADKAWPSQVQKRGIPFLSSVARLEGYGWLP